MATEPRDRVKKKLRGDSPRGFENSRAPVVRPVPNRWCVQMQVRWLQSRVVLPWVLALAVGMAAPAWAQDPPPNRDRPARNEPRPRAQEGMADSVRRVERETRGGRVLSVERMQSGGRNLNRIKAMDDQGRVRVYVDDPQRQRARQQPPRRDDD